MGYLASRSVLTLVNRVLRESGVPEVSSITSKLSNVALEALNDGFADIWQRQRWSFQRYTANLPLVASQQEYTLPGDFDRMASVFRAGFNSLTELTPEHWWSHNYGDMTDEGQPLVYTVEGLMVKFYPIPNQNFIDTFPTLKYQYFKAMPARRTQSDASSSWDLPLDFEDAHVKYGKSKVKQFLEYPDWAADMQGYEQSLRTVRDKYREVRVQPRVNPGDVPQVW